MRGGRASLDGARELRAQAPQRRRRRLALQHNAPVSVGTRGGGARGAGRATNLVRRRVVGVQVGGAGGRVAVVVGLGARAVPAAGRAAVAERHAGRRVRQRLGRVQLQRRLRAARAARAARARRRARCAARLVAALLHHLLRHTRALSHEAHRSCVTTYYYAVGI